MDNFCSVYEEKTGNSWASRNFTKHPNKFYPLEIDYGQVRTGTTCSQRMVGHEFEFKSIARIVPTS